MAACQKEIGELVEMICW